MFMNSFLSKNRLSLALGVLICWVLFASAGIAIELVSADDVGTTVIRPAGPGEGPTNQPVSPPTPVNPFAMCELTCEKPMASCLVVCKNNAGKCFYNAAYTHGACVIEARQYYEIGLDSCETAWQGCSGNSGSGNVHCTNPADEPGYSACTVTAHNLLISLLSSCSSNFQNDQMNCHNVLCGCQQGCCPVIALP